MKRIKSGPYYLEGIFVNDTIPDGEIIIYDTSLGQILGKRQYIKGVLNGVTINYYDSIKIQELTFKDGEKNGIGYIYDSLTTNLRNLNYFFHGKQIGPSYEYSRGGDFSSFYFQNFENEVLFSLEYDSLNGSYFSDKTESLVNFNVDEALVDSLRRLKFFCYTIYPPKTKVEYKVCYFDLFGKIVDSIILPNRFENFYWEGYLDYPQKEQSLAFIVSRFDSIKNKKENVIAYIKSINQK